MGKLRLSVHRKNEQRKKYGVLYRVHVPRDIVSIMPVSIPLDVLPYRASTHLSLIEQTSVTSQHLRRLNASTMRKRQHCLKKQLARLKPRLQEVVTHEGVQVDESLHSDLQGGL